MRMPELKALARERGLRGYSRLRKAELIKLLTRRRRPPHPNRPLLLPLPGQCRTSETQTWELQTTEWGEGPGGTPLRRARQPKLEEAPLTKRQLKLRRNKDSMLNKKFKNLEKEIDDLKSQMDSLKDKITKASESTNARFKRKKIRSMKRDFDKINEKLKESEKKLESIGPLRGFKLHPPNRNKCIEKKIAEISKKIRRAKKKKNREASITKREALKAELNWNPEVRLIDGAFGGAKSRYRIDGTPTMDPETFFNTIRRSLIDLIRKETRGRSVRAQTSTWIRFRRDEDLADLVFNSRMTSIYNLNDIEGIVFKMINHMKEQIENPALINSRFVFDEVLFMNIDLHQLNLMRGSSYLPLPDWLARKKAIINPKNKDKECSNGP